MAQNQNIPRRLWKIETTHRGVATHSLRTTVIDNNDSDGESYFGDSEFENGTNTVAHLQSAATANTSHDSVQSAGNTSTISTTDATRNESMLELFSSDDDSDTASASNFADHNCKSVELTYTSPSNINFSESSGISNSVTLNKKSLPEQFFCCS